MRRPNRPVTIVIIDACEECPYLSDDELRCEKPETYGVVIKDTRVVPDWCRLPTLTVGEEIFRVDFVPRGFLRHVDPRDKDSMTMAKYIRRLKARKRFDQGMFSHT